jgi:hypothetical protein
MGTKSFLIHINLTRCDLFTDVISTETRTKTLLFQREFFMQFRFRQISPSYFNGKKNATNRSEHCIMNRKLLAFLVLWLTINRTKKKATYEPREAGSKKGDSFIETENPSTLATSRNTSCARIPQRC